MKKHALVSLNLLKMKYLAFFLPLFLLTAVRAQEEQVEVVGTEKFILQTEDTLQLAFPGAPELDRNLRIRRDGVVAVPILGEVLAAGKTPRELEQFISTNLEDQLVSSEVSVVVLESNFTYYMEGEIRGPGIIKSFRQLSVLEAIIAAGGVNKNTGKLGSVFIIRRKGDKYLRFELDLKDVLDGKTDKAFILESHDIISVPQRIW